MHKTFLYKLYRHSKTGFIVIAIFILIYGVLLYKKMDMAFFPNNSMFSTAFDTSLHVSTYGVKINDKLVHITGNWYWKKDFLEMSLIEYAAYIKNGQKVYLDNYLRSRNLDQGTIEKLQARLTPNDRDAMRWPLWFAKFAGEKIPFPCRAKIVEYDYTFKNEKAILADSSTIYSFYTQQ